MEEDLNILILSCGSRNKIVQYFKEELKGRGKVIATDCSPLAPALYDADKHFIVPKIYENSYLNTIFSICEENNVKAVFSLIDPEISILAQYENEFLKRNTIPVNPSYEVVETCFDKYKMFKFLIDNNFNTLKSYIDKNEFLKAIDDEKISYPVFVKPVKGSASININKVSSTEEIELLFNRFNNLMIQEFIEGQEYGIDVYIDLISGEPIEIFIKEKIKMRAGETDKSISVKDKKLSDLVREFVKTAGYRGIIDLDVFKMNGEYYISEVNPRFGGGFPHAYENGMNVPQMIINNINGKINEESIGQYNEGNYMMKFNEVKFSGG